MSTIKIDDAKQWAENWQTANPNHCKAFLIPVADLIGCLEEMSVIQYKPDGTPVINSTTDQGVRAYMAIDPTNGTGKSNGYGEKLLVVGTYVDCNNVHRDIIVEEKANSCKTKPPTPTGSGVYDFTDPCPNTCDDNSPLYDPR